MEGKLISVDVITAEWFGSTTPVWLSQVDGLDTVTVHVKRFVQKAKYVQ